MDDLIWRIEPQQSPLLPKVNRQARIKMQPMGQQSMRSRRRRLAKPLKFTPRDSLRKVYEWTRETLPQVWSGFAGNVPSVGLTLIGAAETFEAPHDKAWGV